MQLSYNLNSSDQGFHFIPEMLDESTARNGRILEGQGLSLSLSSSILKNLDYFHGMEDSRNNGNRVHFGYVESQNFLRNSRYLKAGQELLEEFCCVQLKVKKNQDTNPNSASDNGGLSTDHRPLSAAERADSQRRKIKLLSMLDEVSLSLSIIMCKYIHLPM